MGVFDKMELGFECQFNKNLTPPGCFFNIFAKQKFAEPAFIGSSDVNIEAIAVF